MALVERTGELTELARIFAMTSLGSGQMVVIRGGIASGKTELVHVFGQHVRDAQGIMLVATGSEAESTLPLGVINQLLNDERLPAAAVTEILDLMARADTAGEPEETRISHAHAKIAHALCVMLLDVARERAVVVAVDDVHLADSPSIHVLLYLVRRIRSARVMTVLTERVGQRAQGTSVHAEISRHHRHEIGLRMLGEAGITQLISERFGVAPPGLAAAVARLTGGNPLMVNGLLDDQPAMGDVSDEPLVSDCYAKAAFAVLHRGEPAAVHVARGLAVLGERATPALLERLLGVESEVRARVVQGLEESGLVADLRFRHPDVAAAVLDYTPLYIRARLQLDAAGLLHQIGCPALDVARLLIAADEIAGPWAVSVLRSAADHALVDDDVETAIRCLALALGSCGDEREHLEITVALAKLEWRLNPAAAARRLEPLRGKLLNGELSGAKAAMVVRHILWQGDVSTATRAVALLEEAEEVQIAAELRLVLQTIYGRRRGGSGQTRVSSAREPLGASMNPWTRAATSLAAIVHRGVREDTVARASHLLASCTLADSSLDVAVAALLALVHSDRPDIAAGHCEPLAEEASRRGAVTWQAVLLSVRAEVALRQGDLAKADARAREALDLMHPESWGVLVGGPLATLIAANTAMGRHAVAAELVRQVVPEIMTQTVTGVRYLRARGHYHLATDRVLAALEDFQACSRLMVEWDVDRPSFVPWRSDLAQAQLRLGMRESARDLVTEQLERPGDLGPRVKGISLRVLAAGTDLRQRPPLLREAIDLLQSAGDRLELTRTLSDLSQVYHKLGEFGRARMTAARAEQEAKACHAHIVPMQVTRLNGAEGPVDTESPATGEQVLSNAERRVATLAALGHTNREIGQRLYITLSTVEQHLTRVYRKLNVSGRKGLPAGLLPEMLH
ncbi:AAA family ATPase [Sinosporangium siamense]|uniref:AAA family ATPase n=1 Tax=Sinosporangium siamense TaxID=1367973 RepID=UPI0019528645|nr:LuxR family transcriptional regulator [Sinosporangium siamense]